MKIKDLLLGILITGVLSMSVSTYSGEVLAKSSTNAIVSGEIKNKSPQNSNSEKS